MAVGRQTHRLIMNPQIIVCGLGQFGRRVLIELTRQGIAVVGIHPGSPKLEAEPWSEAVDEDDERFWAEHSNIVFGPPRSAKTLMEAGILKAQTLLLTGSDDALNLAILTQARLLNPQIRIVNRLYNIELGQRLDLTLAQHVSLSESTLVAPMFAFAAMQRSIIGQLNLLGKIWPVTVEQMTPYHPLLGKSLHSLWSSPHRMLLSYESYQQPEGLMAAIQTGKRLQVGDRLVWTELQHAKPPRRSVRRFMQTMVRGLQQFQSIGQAMLLVLLGLLLTIALTVTVYLAHNPAVSAIDALYFSVGMITGAGGQEIVVESSPGQVKVFTVIMMLLGAGVIGVFYALLNDFVLGTHLQRLWTTTHMPQSGHHIICGLGGVGYRVVDLLGQLGEEVVAIERDPQSQMIRAARVRKTPVIVGNATIPDILKLANIHKAATLLAVTSDDAVNLELAITAKSLAPHLSVLVRIYDPRFAYQIQQVFDFDRVISPTDLTAPAFAAAAVGGKILGNYSTRRGLWLAISTLITPPHPLCDRTVLEAASMEAFTPLYAEVGQQIIRGYELLELKLTAGVNLYLMISVKRWDQLWRVRAEL